VGDQARKGYASGDHGYRAGYVTGEGPDHRARQRGERGKYQKSRDRRPSAERFAEAAILARMRWEVHSEKPLYTDEWLDVRIADVELPDGRHLDHRLIRTRPGAGVVLVRDGQVLLLWRHRFITDSWGYEIPLGKLDPGEDPAAGAAREFEEETGWRPGPLEYLLRVEPTPGLYDGVHHVYQAQDATHVGPPEDPFESERIEWVSLADVPRLAAEGKISSGTTLAALLYALSRETSTSVVSSGP